MFIELEVENVTCEGCASRIKDEIGKIGEVSVLNIRVDESLF